MGSERPDAAKSCKRKTAYSCELRKQIPNWLELPGNCAEHQAHRCVAATEKGVIGDIHAQMLVASHLPIQNRLRQKLWDICDEVDWVPHNHIVHNQGSICITTLCAGVRAGIYVNLHGSHIHIRCKLLLTLLGVSMLWPHANGFYYGRSFSRAVVRKWHGPQMLTAMQASWKLSGWQT